MILLADIGGTNARFRFETADGAPLGDVKLATGAHDNLAAAYEEARAQCAATDLITTVLVCWAGPVQDGAGRLTNQTGWDIDEATLKTVTGAGRAYLINDFAAQVLAVPALAAAQVHPVLPGDDRPASPFAILGPGTGLGVGMMSRRDGQGHVLPGEGGHITLTARTQEEFDLIACAKQVGWPDQPDVHLSAERFLSGGELWRLYQAVAMLGGTAIHDRLTGEAIADLATKGDQVAQKTIGHFHDFLGTVASDLAVTCGALGGIWLTGDLLKAWRSTGLLDDARLISRFQDKGRFSDYCAACGLYQVMADDPAFIGLRALYSSTSSA